MDPEARLVVDRLPLKTGRRATPMGCMRERSTATCVRYGAPHPQVDARLPCLEPRQAATDGPGTSDRVEGHRARASETG